MSKIFHGQTEYHFNRYHTRNGTIPYRWTDSPLQALSYSLVFRLDNPSGIVIFEIERPEDFQLIGEGISSSFLPELTPKKQPLWYLCLNQLFRNEQERDSKIKIYRTEDMPEFIEQHALPENRERLLEIINP